MSTEHEDSGKSSPVHSDRGTNTVLRFNND